MHFPQHLIIRYYFIKYINSFLSIYFYSIFLNIYSRLSVFYTSNILLYVNISFYNENNNKGCLRQNCLFLFLFVKINVHNGCLYLPQLSFKVCPLHVNVFNTDYLTLWVLMVCSLQCRCLSYVYKMYVIIKFSTTVTLKHT